MPARDNSETPNVLRNWWRVSLRAKGVAVLAVPMAALFAVLFSIRWVEGDVRETETKIDRAYAMRAQLVQLHSSLDDAEQALAGYLPTGQTGFLSLYNAGRAQVQKSIGALDPMVAPDAHATTEFAEIRRLSTHILTQLEAMRGPGPRAPLDSDIAQREKAAMADAQARINLLSDYEERLFTAARYERDLARRRLFGTVIFCGILGPFGALFTHLLIAGRMVRRLQLVEENARRLAHGLPLEPFPTGTDEIASLGKQLQDAAYLLRERELKLSESVRRYRELFDQAPIPYEEADRDGVIRRFNQAMCTLLKRSPQQMVGRHAWDLVAPDRQEEFRAAFMDRLARGYEAGPWEIEYLLDDGSRISVEIRENLIRNDRGEVTGILRSLLDITERNLAAVAARKVEQYAIELRSKNEQLARALEAARSATVAKSRFLASVSHELRTPLNGIIGFSEMLFDGRIGGMQEEQREFMGDILTSSRHLLQLINDILDLSKVEAGRMDFRFERHLLQTLVVEVRDVVRPAAEKKSIALAVDVPAGLGATLDPARFKQVLYNYLSNAVKFTPEHGRIDLRIAREGQGSFRLEVEDTGIGIRSEEIPLLFQEFAQLPNSRKAEQGAGLSLALTRHIVEAQGGSVAVRSIPGKGSVFSAVLPLESIVRRNNS
jgi:PAS domain S-box-containing protein